MVLGKLSGTSTAKALPVRLFCTRRPCAMLQGACQVAQAGSISRSACWGTSLLHVLPWKATPAGARDEARTRHVCVLLERLACAISAVSLVPFGRMRLFQDSPSVEDEPDSEASEARRLLNICGFWNFKVLRDRRQVSSIIDDLHGELKADMG